MLHFLVVVKMMMMKQQAHSLAQKLSGVCIICHTHRAASRRKAERTFAAYRRAQLVKRMLYSADVRRVYSAPLDKHCESKDWGLSYSVHSSLPSALCPQCRESTSPVVCYVCG